MTMRWAVLGVLEAVAMVLVLPAAAVWSLAALVRFGWKTWTTASTARVWAMYWTTDAKRARPASPR